MHKTVGGLTLMRLRDVEKHSKAVNAHSKALTSPDC